MDIKQTSVTLLLLFAAALLEAGGDAVVRTGLHASTTFMRMALFVAGGLVLFSYGYVVNAPPAELKPIPLEKATPLDLYEARNAVRIARWVGADKSAAESYVKAEKLLLQAEAYKARKAGTKPVAMIAREAAQTAEDARLIALKRQEDQRLERERQAAADR